MTITDDERLKKFLESYDRQVRALKHELLRITWAMRGGITYNEAMELSLDERNIIADIIKDNIEVTKTTKLPYF